VTCCFFASKDSLSPAQVPGCGASLSDVGDQNEQEINSGKLISSTQWAIKA
jgi:hypothetical protein